MIYKNKTIPILAYLWTFVSLFLKKNTNAPIFRGVFVFFRVLGEFDFLV